MDKAQSILDQFWIDGTAGNVEDAGLNLFLAQLTGSIWQHLDFGTVVATVMAFLLLAGGFYDRKARKAQPERTCAECMGPLVGQLESLMRALQEFMMHHDSRSTTHNALHEKAHEEISKDLTAINGQLSTILLHLNGRGRS